MADVLIVCVREDEPQAKALADMFEAAGFSVGGAPASDSALRSSGAGVVVWSQASIRSRPFLDAAQRVVNSGKAVIASLIEPPPPESVGDAQTFDLSRWSGDGEDPQLDPIFFAVDRMVTSARAAIGMAPAQTPAAFEPPPNLRPPPSTPPYGRSPRNTAPVMQPPPPTLPPGFQTRTNPQRGGYGQQHEPAGSEEHNHWRTIRNSKDPTDFLDYLARYGPEGEFSELAELRLKQLEGGAEQLRGAARAAQNEPQRSYNPQPPQRRPEPPRVYEPPTAYLPPQRERGYEPPRRAEARRPEPKPEPRPEQRRRPEPRYERDYRPPDDEPARSGGGVLRMLVLLILLGGGVFVGGVYFGLGDKLTAAIAGSPTDEENLASGAAPPLDEPASAPGDTDGATPQIEEAVSEPAFDPPAPSTRNQRPVQVASARQASQPALRSTTSDAAEPPTPLPQTNWGAPNSTPTSANGGGPVSLLPSNSGQSASVPISPGPVSLASANVAATTSTSSTAPSVLWAQRPTGQRLSSVYPRNALRDNMSGSAQLDCVVRADLGITCAIAGETPAGQGFGRAALSAVQYYRSRPTLSDGASAVGARTRVSISFRAPRD